VNDLSSTCPDGPAITILVVGTADGAMDDDLIDNDLGRC
jgi:hypothetical protein